MQRNNIHQKNYFNPESKEHIEYVKIKTKEVKDSISSLNNTDKLIAAGFCAVPILLVMGERKLALLAIVGTLIACYTRYLNTAPHKKKVEELLNIYQWAVTESSLKAISFYTERNKEILKEAPNYINHIEDYHGYQKFQNQEWVLDLTRTLSPLVDGKKLYEKWVDQSWPSRSMARCSKEFREALYQNVFYKWVIDTKEEKKLAKSKELDKLVGLQHMIRFGLFNPAELFKEPEQKEAKLRYLSM